MASPLPAPARQSATRATLASGHASQPTASGEGRRGLTPGQVVSGKYRVDHVLGAGSMGVVMSAEHLDLGITVAIKSMHPQARASSEALTRFQREARAAAHIRGEHVARVLDVGSLDDGTPFIVMEHLEGEDLAQRLERVGPLPIPEAVEWVMQACEALGEAHGIGIVHRDIKPQNLFCARRPDGTFSLKVLDFGISKMASIPLTETRACVGTPCYMSPEQLQSSRNADARSDVWSLGAVLYELVTGQVPFGGETMPELCTHILTQSPAPMRLHGPEVPEALEAATLRCLAKDRVDRFANVAELATALAPFASPGAAARLDAIARLVEPRPDPSASRDDGRIEPRFDPPAHVASGTRSWCPATLTVAIGPASCCGALPLRPRSPTRDSGPLGRRVLHWLNVAGIGAAVAFVLLRHGGEARSAESVTAAAAVVASPVVTPAVITDSPVPAAALMTAAGDEAPAAAPETSASGPPVSIVPEASATAAAPTTPSPSTSESSIAATASPPRAPAKAGSSAVDGRWNAAPAPPKTNLYDARK